MVSEDQDIEEDEDIAKVVSKKRMKLERRVEFYPLVLTMRMLEKVFMLVRTFKKDTCWGSIGLSCSRSLTVR